MSHQEIEVYGTAHITVFKNRPAYGQVTQFRQFFDESWDFKLVSNGGKQNS